MIRGPLIGLALAALGCAGTQVVSIPPAAPAPRPAQVEPPRIEGQEGLSALQGELRLLARMDGVHLAATGLERPRFVLALEGGRVPGSARGAGAGFRIEPLAAAFEGRVAPDCRAAPSSEAGAEGEPPAHPRLELSLDPRLPYETVARLVYTAGQVGFCSLDFVILVEGGEGLEHEAGVRLQLPAWPAERGVRLFVEASRMAIESREGPFSCARHRGASPDGTIPRDRDGLDRALVLRCLSLMPRRLRRSDAITLVFSPDEPFAEVVRLLAGVALHFGTRILAIEPQAWSQEERARSD